MRSGGFMEFKKHDLFKHFKKAHKQKFMQRRFAVGDSKKRDEHAVLEHYVRKESKFNFEEASKDTSFDFDEHIRKKKSATFGKAAGLDFITAQNVKDFVVNDESDSESMASGKHYGVVPELSNVTEETMSPRPGEAGN